MRNREEERELLIRRRTVKGWAFKALPAEEEAAIKAFLAGGPVPAGYQRRYEQECQLAGRAVQK